MKKGLTEIVFILDKSGSMGGLETDTIGGYNAFIEKQKKLEGQALVSTVLFSDQSQVIHDRQELSTIEKMTDSQYMVGGCTALLDAIGGAVRYECDALGTQLNFTSLSETIGCVRMGKAIKSDWNKKIKDHYKKSGRK